MTDPTPIRASGMIPDLDQTARLVEALLFASGAPLSDAELRDRLPEATVLEPLMAALELAYRGRGINLVRVAGGWTFLTAPDLAAYLAKETPVARRLSRAQLEALAIIAYHQPVTRAEIEEIRGVSLSTTTLDLLMQTGWIEPRGRKQTVGRPTTWVTTKAFLMHFGLDSVQDLPNAEELRAAGLLDARVVESLGEKRGEDMAAREETPEEL